MACGIQCHAVVNAVCTLKISGTEEEVLQAATAHAVSVHGHANTPELVNELRGLLRQEPDERAS